MILDTISNPRCKLNNDTLIASTRSIFIIRIQCYFVAKNHQKFFWSDFQTNQLDVCRLMVLISIDKSFSFCLTYLRWENPRTLLLGTKVLYFWIFLNTQYHKSWYKKGTPELVFYLRIPWCAWKVYYHEKWNKIKATFGVKDFNDFCYFWIFQNNLHKLWSFLTCACHLSRLTL